MQETPYILGFTAGELSPWLSCRFDLQAYHRGAARLENFLVQPYGGLKRRPGTVYVDSLSSGSVRLFPFHFDESDILMLEFSAGKVRFFKNGVPVKRGNSAYTLPLPWTSTDIIDALHFVQLNDVIYITAPQIPPHVLKRFSNTQWVLEELSLNPYPRETYAPQSTALRVAVYPNGEATVECDEDVFTTAMAGAEYLMVDAPFASRTLFLNDSFTLSNTELPNLATVTTPTVVGKVYYKQNTHTGLYEYYTCIRSYTKECFAGSTSPADYGAFFYPGAMILHNNYPYEVAGDWELRTNGTWNAAWEIWRSYDNYMSNVNFHHWDWTCIKSFEQTEYANRENWALSGSEDRPCRLALVCRASNALTVSPMLYLKIHGGTHEYKFKITQVDSHRSATCDCYSYYGTVMDNFTTKQWSFGACGVRNGYPAFAGFHQNRLWFGGIPGLPTTLIASAVGDYGDFGVGSESDSALHLTLASFDQSRICWIYPARALLVGTTNSEWTLAAPDGGTISPNNANFTRQSSVGSDPKPASGVENTVFFVQRGGKHLREISYKIEADGFTSTDTSLLAEHLFSAGISEWAVQHGNGTRLWVLMADGSLAVLVTNAEQQVTAWQRVSFSGRSVLHLATLPSAAGDDEVWFVIRNNTSNAVSLERLTEGNTYLDGLYTGRPTILPHLAGCEGYCYPKGLPNMITPVRFDSHGSYLVSDEDDVYGNMCFGVTIHSELQTMPLEQEPSFNTIRQEGRVRLRLMESFPQFRYGSTHSDKWESYVAVYEADSKSYTGSIRLSQIPFPGVGQGFKLLVDNTYPFQLLALTIDFDYHSR